MRYGAIWCSIVRCGAMWCDAPLVQPASLPSSPLYIPHPTTPHPTILHSVPEANANMEEIFTNLQANLGKMSMLGVRVVESGQYDYKVDLIKMTQVSHSGSQWVTVGHSKLQSA